MGKNWNREPVRRAGSRFFLTVVCLLAGAAAAGSETWSDDRLRAFLASHNAQEAVLVLDLAVRQGGRALPVWEPAGREEVRQRLRERLILTPADPVGPFVRGNEYVFRVDRAQDLDIRLRMQRCRLEPGSGRLRREDPSPVRLRLSPSGDVFWLAAGPAGYAFSLPAGRVERSVKLQVLSRDQRHTLTLTLLNLKTPVTLQNPPTP